MVALGRALLADPDLPVKAREGQATVRPCIGCCLGCIHAVLQLEPGGCVVNPDVGREYTLAKETVAAERRNILVVGGGPAGMAAARMAALRGHRVTLVEAEARLGGLFRLAALAPGRQEAGDIINFFSVELDRLGVDLRLEAPLTQARIDALAPDTVILATGSLPAMPVIRGFSGTRLPTFTVVEVMSGEEMPDGERILVLGGGQSALMLADYLAEAGKTVTVLNRGRHFAAEMSSNDRFYLRERLNRSGVQMHKNVSVDGFRDRGVSFRSGGQAHALEGLDALVVSEGMTPIRQARSLFEGRNIDVHLIGDAREARNLMLAISEGEEIARTL
jgi:NADPH-dependent 2,4-dienoyl-CoA reductase/sulfur reductase-like enzyme